MVVRRHILILLMGVVVMAATGSSALAERQTIGYLENVRLFPGDLPMKAKIDTGARTSSIDVRDPHVFEREGRKWVKFKIQNSAGEESEVERPVVREAKVRRSGTERQIRYVIRLGVCLADYFKIAEVNLNDRTGMNYRFLVGRLYLGDVFLIDSSKKYLTKPDCQETTDQ